MHHSTFALLRAAATFMFVLLAAVLASPAVAQPVPSEFTQRILIKSTLMTFHDAIVTNNFDVLHARAAAPFREKFSVDDLAKEFKPFVDNEITFIAFVDAEHIDDEPAKVEEGVLTLLGHFQLKPGKVSYRLRYMIDGDQWRMVGINVNVSED